MREAKLTINLMKSEFVKATCTVKYLGQVKPLDVKTKPLPNFLSLPHRKNLLVF